MMRRNSRISVLLLAACIFGVIAGGPTGVFAGEKSSPYNVPKGVYIDLDMDSLKTMSSNQGGSRIHTTETSQAYLQMILKNQEEIIRLLHELLEPKK